MAEGSGRGSGRVRLFVGNRGSGRVGSTFRRVGSGWVQEKWPVDNSMLFRNMFKKLDLVLLKKLDFPTIKSRLHYTILYY